MIFFVYRRLKRDGDVADPGLPSARAGVLRRSRRTVLELAALFSLDSAGGGFVVTSLLVLWLHLRFDLSAGVTGAVFFAAGVLGGCSQFFGAAAGGAFRAHPHHGVHAHARERVAGADGVRPDRRDRDHDAAHPVAVRADGCARRARRS